jgi:pyruvate dehydrogenase E2 component (dihydrolipoamide acetyltransferase)
VSAAVEIRIEDPGDSEELEILELSVAVGATVTAGQKLLEVAADKANLEVTAPADGVVAEILVAEGDIIHPGAVLLRLATA